MAAVHFINRKYLCHNCVGEAACGIHAANSRYREICGITEFSEGVLEFVV
jgi:hypothetical protein